MNSRKTGRLRGGEDRLEFVHNESALDRQHDFLSCVERSSGRNGDRPQSLLDVPISGVGRRSNKRQQEEVHEEQGGEYVSCFCRVTFLTRLQ